MALKDSLIKDKEFPSSMNLHQGDCIRLQSDEDLFQVIGIDYEHERCWVRRWPLLPNGSPVFEIPIHQIASPSRQSEHSPASTT